MANDYDAPGCEIGKVLARVFRDLRWTKAEFSRQTGVEAAQVGKYYTGAQTPTPGRLREWAKIRALAPYEKAFSAAWDADEEARVQRKKATGRSARRGLFPVVDGLEPAARDAVDYIIAVLKKYPSVAKPLVQRAKALERVESGAADAEQQA